MVWLLLAGLGFAFYKANAAKSVDESVAAADAALRASSGETSGYQAQGPGLPQVVIDSEGGQDQGPLLGQAPQRENETIAWQGPPYQGGKANEEGPLGPQLPVGYGTVLDDGKI